MLLRYLGNKQDLLAPLLAELARHCEPGSHVVDIFSGSLAVALGMKREGYLVTANDINLFSYILGEAYLRPTDLPASDITQLVSTRLATSLKVEAQAHSAHLCGTPGHESLTRRTTRERFIDLLVLQRHLNTLEPKSLPKAHRKTYFFDAYCEAGANSGFVSSRGAKGRRRFFSPANAARIDTILNQLRMWRVSGAIDLGSYSLLLATLLRAAEKVANTQGTYHDFPRTAWDSRASGRLWMAPPPVDLVASGAGGHTVGRERDSLEYITETPAHSLLYLDPPYNFRQYSAYYFLPNVICRYPEMADPDDYFGRLTYVRGQNPSDDFTSTFCKPKRFIADLRTLIDRAKCETVMLSYFTGKNHWNSFDEDASDRGLHELQELLEGDLFEAGSFSMSRVPRTNYASYGGYRARGVDELILVARKRKEATHGGPAASSRRRLQSVA